jgi:hypothetical protein
MLTRIYIDNYRCFTNFDWKPGKLVLIAGRNGTGKSTLFSALEDLWWLMGGASTDSRFAESDLTRWDTRREQVFELDVVSRGRSYRYRLVLDHGEDGSLPWVKQERLQLVEPQQMLFEFRDGQVQLYKPDGAKGPRFPADGSRSPLSSVPVRENEAIGAFRHHIAENCWVIAPLPPRFRAEAREESRWPDRDLEGFVAWYRHVSGDSFRVSELTRTLATVLDGFMGLRLEDSGRKAKVLQAVFGTREGGRVTSESVFDLNELSDGQRALIALYAILEFGPVQDGVLCIDEPDNFVGLAEIEPWLRALEARLDDHDGQVFLASHNAEVINRLWQGHGVIFEREPRGAVRPPRPMDDSTGLPPAEVIARGLE